LSVLHFETLIGVVRFQVASVPEDSDTADALRSVMHRLTAEDFLVVSGDLVSDVPIGAVAAAHRRQEALVTALLCNRASLGSSEPGSEKIKREPVSDIIGLDSTQQHLLYVSPGPEVSLRASCHTPLTFSVFQLLTLCFSQIERDLRVRRSLLRAVGTMEIRTDLVDAHLYAFNRLIVQGVLESRPTIKSIKQDLVPYLVRSQLRLGVASTAVGSPVEDKEDTHHQPSLPESEVFSQLLRSSQSVNRAPASPLKCCTYIASNGKFCVRVNSLQVCTFCLAF
jgi:translation initiation factor eIF-2B subunit gamma